LTFELRRCCGRTVRRRRRPHRTGSAPSDPIGAPSGFVARVFEGDGEVGAAGGGVADAGSGLSGADASGGAAIPIMPRTAAGIATSGLR
jgi:hypothetical protein